MEFSKEKYLTKKCPECGNKLSIHHPDYSYSFMCPVCSTYLYWNKENKKLKINPNRNKENDKIIQTTKYDAEIENIKTKKETLNFRNTIIITLLLLIFDILFLSTLFKNENKKNQKIIRNLEIYQSNILELLDQEEFIKAEFEINKMKILNDLPSTDKEIWKSNRDILIRLFEEKSGRKILIDP